MLALEPIMTPRSSINVEQCFIFTKEGKDALESWSFVLIYTHCKIDNRGQADVKSKK